jgi:hypothetical protein
MTHDHKLIFFRGLSFALAPPRFLLRNLSIWSPLLVGFVATFVALTAIREDLKPWFPVPIVRGVMMILFSFLVGLIAALASIKETRDKKKLHSLIVEEYLNYVVDVVQGKMDQRIGNMERLGHPSHMTMSIMIPHGSAALVRARSLKIMAASSRLRALPSMNLTLAWGEGVAGKVWSQGVHAAELAVKVDPQFWKEKIIVEVSAKKKTIGGFPHRAGVSFPIITVSTKDITGAFLGVLNIGSDREEDYEFFTDKQFRQDTYEFIRGELKSGVGLLTLRKVD